MITETDLDNVLVAQKDYIIDVIDHGDPQRALAMLSVVHKLWVRCDGHNGIGYGYKFDELVARLNNRMESLNYDARYQVEGNCLVERILLKKTFSIRLT